MLTCPLGSGFDAGDDAARDSPAFGGISEVTVAADLVAFTLEKAESGVLGEGADLAQQHRIAGQAEDVADAVALAPRHRLGPAVMAVAAHHISTAGQRRWQDWAVGTAIAPALMRVQQCTILKTTPCPLIGGIFCEVVVFSVTLRAGVGDRWASI
jgi:hypothetical protein